MLDINGIKERHKQIGRYFGRPGNDVPIDFANVFLAHAHTDIAALSESFEEMLEIIKGAEITCGIATQVKLEAISSRDYWKIRAETAEKDLDETTEALKKQSAQYRLNIATAEVLEADRNRWQALAEKYKPSYDKCHDCPIVCVKTDYLRLLDENERLNARAEAAEEKAKSLQRILSKMDVQQVNFTSPIEPFLSRILQEKLDVAEEKALRYFEEAAVQRERAEAMEQIPEGKAALFVDAPSECAECKFGKLYGFVGEVKCLVTNEYFTTPKSLHPRPCRPDKCPLVVVREKQHSDVKI